MRLKIIVKKIKKTINNILHKKNKEIKPTIK
jgi:hypothetical protein